jgi:hypothetical protein
MRRLLRSAVATNPCTWLVLWVGIFTGLSYLPDLPHGDLHWKVPAATTGSLTALWQVQAASVGLVLTLVVFVFGLLPQGRGRLTYRQFLRRTWALPLTAANVASLVFNGLVLLGIGHMVPPSGSTLGYGWAVNLASCISLLSVASIVVVLTLVMLAVNPATQVRAQGEYQDAAVVQAVQEELIERVSLELLDAGSTGSWLFSRSRPKSERAVEAGRRQRGAVRDVAVWRLRLLQPAVRRGSRHKPVVLVWPGKAVVPGTPLITLDPSVRRLGQWWGRHCVSVHPGPADILGGALAALHGETLEHIRAGRAEEGSGGMKSMVGLQEIASQVYAAHDRPYQPYADWPLDAVGYRIAELLDTELRAAAVSPDDAIQREAAVLPARMAWDATIRKEPGIVRQGMRYLESVYMAVAGDLSGGGERDLPSIGLVMSRLHAPFRSLLSLVNYYLAPQINEAASKYLLEQDEESRVSADFLLDQLRVANEVTLEMLRRAVQFRDSATVRRVLRVWQVPDLSQARNASAGEALARSIDDAEADLDAMVLRLLVTALDAGQAAALQEAPAAAQGAGVSGPDPVTEAIITRLPAGRLWATLERALQASDGDWRWQLFSDDEIIPGPARLIDTDSPLMEAFALVALIHPELAGGAPTRQFALDRGAALITVIDQALAGQGEWLTRYGCLPDTAAANAGDLKARLGQVIESAGREQEEDIRQSPIRDAAVDEARQAARAAFKEHDIAGALFTWAGRTAPPGGQQPVSATLDTSRRDFTDPSYEGIPNSHGQRLARVLGVRALGELLRTASEQGEKRTVGEDAAVAAIREAIAQLSASPSAPDGQEAPAAKTVVFIPDTLFFLIYDLGEGSWQKDVSAAGRSQVIQELGVENDALASQVALTVGGALVIKASALTRQVLVINLDRFGKLCRAAPGGTGTAEPDLAVTPIDPPHSGAATGSAPPAGNRPGPPMVLVTLSIPDGIAVEDASAARVIKIE